MAESYCRRTRGRAQLLVRAGLLIASSVALFGCSLKVTDFSFKTGGSNITVLAPHGTPKDSQAGFVGPSKSANDSPQQTPRYTLKPRPSVAGKTDAFYLEYTAESGPLSLHLYERNPSTGAQSQTTTLLPSSNTTADNTAPSRSSAGQAEQTRFRFLVPVPEHSQIGGFQVTGGSPASTIHILGAGLTKDFSGVDFNQNLLTIRDGVTLDEPSGKRGQTLTDITFSNLVSNLDTKQVQIVLKYSSTGEHGTIQLAADDSSKQPRKYYLIPRKGTHRLYLYTASVGFTPDSLRLISDNPGFKLDSLVVHPFKPVPGPTDSLGATNPIPADFGAMIDYRPEYWRQKGYELFSWSLIPSVLVMQFENYAVQARYMKRFAFFVEKYGYTGKLWTNEQLAHLHGWNAHDYRPEDLARFYTKAAAEHFTLNPEELHLREILTKNGLIVPDGNGYKAGKGAILTFAHVGPYWLRRLLITHEGYHGIFFTHPAYREAVFSIWDKTPVEEQDLFRDVFLYWAHYDIRDPYLVKNEFQAYLMQQPTSAVQGYFDNELSYEMKRMQIPPDSPLMKYFDTHTRAFHDSALEVQKAVEEAVGVTAGGLVGLSPE